MDIEKPSSWILDLYAWAMRANRVTKAGGIHGVLLVDEVEQHLHPSMQTTLLARLREIVSRTASNRHNTQPTCHIGG